MITRPKTAVRRLALSRLISVTGGAAAFTALMFVIYERTHSAAWLSAALLMTFGVEAVLSPFAGALGDRFDRKRVMIVSELLGAVAFGALAFARDPGLMIGLAFVAAVVGVPFYSSADAAIPNLLGDESELGWANGLIGVGVNAGIMIGPAIGGVALAAIGSSWVFALNAGTFVISAAIVWRIHAPFSDALREHDELAHRGILAGFRFIAHDRILRTIVLGWTVLLLGAGFCMVADVPLAELFHAGSRGYGLMISSWGAGSILGSLGGRFVRERNERWILVLGIVAVALGTTAVAVSPVFWPVLIATLLSGAGDAVVGVAGQGIQQRRTPDVVRSRVMAASDTIPMAALTVSFALAGAVLATIGPRAAYLIGGASALVAAAVMLPVLRGRPRDDAAGSGQRSADPVADAAVGTVTAGR